MSGVALPTALGLQVGYFVTSAEWTPNTLGPSFRHKIGNAAVFIGKVGDRFLESFRCGKVFRAHVFFIHTKHGLVKYIITFDNGVLTLDLTRLIESKGKPWVSEVESSRLILWKDQWRRIGDVARELRQPHPGSFRRVLVRCRNGEQKEFWAFSKSVRLKCYGRKRIAMVHERADLTDTLRFLMTDAVQWESGRRIDTWSFRWAAEVFHEFSKQGTGLEAAQVRNEEAGNRHLRLSCLAQSILQRTPTVRRHRNNSPLPKERSPLDNAAAR